MKTSTSTTENTEVKFSHAETLEELKGFMNEGEIVKLTNDYLNRHHFLPEVRDAIRRVNNPDPTAVNSKGLPFVNWCKGEDAQLKQLEEATGVMAQIARGPEFSLYDFAPERRGESKGGKKVAAAVNAVKDAIVKKLVAGGMDEDAARAIADAV